MSGRMLSGKINFYIWATLFFSCIAQMVHCNIIQLLLLYFVTALEVGTG